MTDMKKLDDSTDGVFYGPIMENAKELIRKVMGLPVEFRSEGCKAYIKANTCCNDCRSYPGCQLVLVLLNWIGDNSPDNYSKEGLKHYVEGMRDGYVFGNSISMTKGRVR